MLKCQGLDAQQALTTLKTDVTWERAVLTDLARAMGEKS